MGQPYKKKKQNKQTKKKHFNSILTRKFVLYFQGPPITRAKNFKGIRSPPHRVFVNGPVGMPLFRIFSDIRIFVVQIS